MFVCVCACVGVRFRLFSAEPKNSAQLALNWFLRQGPRKDVWAAGIVPPSRKPSNIQIILQTL